MQELTASVHAPCRTSGREPRAAAALEVLRCHVMSRPHTADTPDRAPTPAGSASVARPYASRRQSCIIAGARDEPSRR